MKKLLMALGLLVAVIASGGCWSPTDVDYDAYFNPTIFRIGAVGAVAEGGIRVSRGRGHP